MFKLCSVLFCGLLTYQVANAVLQRLRPQEKPAEFAGQEGCYVPALQRVLKTNETSAPVDGQCKRYQCFDNGEVAIASCDESQGTVVPGDSSKGYPDCCKQQGYTEPAVAVYMDENGNIIPKTTDKKDYTGSPVYRDENGNIIPETTDKNDYTGSPVYRDENGNIVPKTCTESAVYRDENGNIIPETNTGSADNKDAN